MFSRKISQQDEKNILKTELKTLEVLVEEKRKEYDEFTNKLEEKRLLQKEIATLKQIIKTFLD